MDDAAEALRAAALSDAAGTFVLASGEWPAVREGVERVRDWVDPALPLGFGEIEAGPLSALRGDPTRLLRGVTGWSPRIGADEGVRRTVECFKSHRPRSPRVADGRTDV